MRCIFCKGVSDASRSVEHIIPEFLGNVDYLLPKGWVCDSCNNYFARKVEGPFLASQYGRYSRFEMGIANKENRVPPAIGIYPQARSKIMLFRSPSNGELSFCAHDEKDEPAFIAALQAGGRGSHYLPTATMPDLDMTTSRFIGKIALEILAFRLKAEEGWNDEVVDHEDLDELRAYVRNGMPQIIWPIHMRRIYDPHFMFVEEGYEPHQKLHEWTLLWTPDSELYAIIAIFGIEYAINMGGPEIDGYEQWLQENQMRSPLY